MKLFTFSLLLFTGINTAIAQVTFQKTYGGGMEGKCYVAKTPDGGYAIGGSTTSFSTGGVYLVRTDSAGNMLWTKTYGSSFGGDQANDIQTTTDGGFILAGTTPGFGERNGDLYLIRTDANGDTLWTRTYGNTLGDYALAVQQTSDGGFIAVGTFNTSGNCYMVRTKPNGDTLWTKSYMGGDGYGVIQTGDKGFVVSGVMSSISNGLDMFLYKTDSMGNMKWCRTYGGSNVEYGSRVHMANDGGYITLGFSSTFDPGTSDVYVVKTDTAGKVQWSKTYRDALSNDGADLVSTGNGYTLLCRSTAASVTFNTMLINIDNNGNLNWAKNYYAGYACNIVRANDGGYAFTGYNLGSFNNVTNFYFTKTDSLGNIDCNDSVNHSIEVGTPPTHTDTLYPAVSNGTLVGKPPTLTGSGGTETTLCLTSGVQMVMPSANALFVYPNPCTTCAIKGAVNTSDLMVTDVLGRNVPLTFIKSSDAYIMQLPGTSTGIYFVRDVKTGQVVKVVKE